MRRRNHRDRLHRFITACRATTASFALDPGAPLGHRFCAEPPHSSREEPPRPLPSSIGPRISAAIAASGAMTRTPRAPPGLGGMFERAAVVLRRIDAQMVPLGQVRTMRWLREKP